MENKKNQYLQFSPLVLATASKQLDIDNLRFMVARGFFIKLNQGETFLLWNHSITTDSGNCHTRSRPYGWNKLVFHVQN